MLDGLNAWEAIDRCRRHFPSGTCFGPGIYSGGSGERAWVGVLIWRRAPGYYGYKTLTLYGVWGESRLEPDASIGIRVGARLIPYTSDFYTAEAWFTLMRERFDDYYDDDGHPPDDAPTVLIADSSERLAQRTALVEALTLLVRGG